MDDSSNPPLKAFAKGAPSDQDNRNTNMDDSSNPPLKMLAAAAVGGFAGAVLGVVAATSMMGDGDTNDSQGANSATETETTEMVAAER